MITPPPPQKKEHFLRICSLLSVIDFLNLCVCVFSLDFVSNICSSTIQESVC